VAESLIAAARAHAPEVGDQLRVELAELTQDGEALPDFTHFHVQLAGYLERRLAALVEAEARHQSRLDSHREARLRRDAAGAELEHQIIELRETVSAVWGSNAVEEILGIPGSTAGGLLTLERCAERILTWVRERQAKGLPEPRPGLEIDLDPLLEDLAAKHEELRRILEEEAKARRALETTRQGLGWALAVVDQAVRGVARLLQGCYHLADCSEYSRRIRLTAPRHRVARTQSGRES